MATPKIQHLTKQLNLFKMKMSAPPNLYAKKLMNVAAEDKDNGSMHESSPCSKDSGFEGMHNAGEDAQDNEAQANAKPLPDEKEEIDFEDNPFQIPPSFSYIITKETLWDNN